MSVSMTYPEEQLPAAPEREIRSGGFIHANDAAMAVSAYPRVALDFYPTEEWVTEALVPTLLSIRHKSTPVWEPACGDGAMARVLSRHFDTVHATDISNYGYGQPGVDFLGLDTPLADVIITNPPYGDKAEEFIRHALKITAQRNGVVAMLLRNEYDCSKGRIDLFQKPPYFRKVVLTSRPRWIPGSTGAPRHNYSWFIWNFGSIAMATVTYYERVRPRASANAGEEDVGVPG